MDQEHFDTLTRALAAGLSRRSVLRTLSAVGAGGVLAAVGRGTAEAGKCKKANRCGKGKHRTCCKNGETCDNGTCVPDAPDNRVVTLSFESFDQYHTHCWVTVHVTGFAEGSYTGSVGNSQEFTVQVGADGTGSWSSTSINTIWGVGGTVTATVDGKSSGEEPLTC
jgi:hypothetical protein